MEVQMGRLSAEVNALRAERLSAAAAGAPAEEGAEAAALPCTLPCETADEVEEVERAVQGNPAITNRIVSSYQRLINIIIRLFLLRRANCHLWVRRLPSSKRTT